MRKRDEANIVSMVKPSHRNRQRDTALPPTQANKPNKPVSVPAPNCLLERLRLRQESHAGTLHSLCSLALSVYSYFVCFALVCCFCIFFVCSWPHSCSKFVHKCMCTCVILSCLLTLFLCMFVLFVRTLRDVVFQCTIYVFWVWRFSSGVLFSFLMCALIVLALWFYVLSLLLFALFLPFSSSFLSLRISCLGLSCPCSFRGVFVHSLCLSFGACLVESRLLSFI